MIPVVRVIYAFSCGNYQQPDWIYRVLIDVFFEILLVEYEQDCTFLEIVFRLLSLVLLVQFQFTCDLLTSAI